VLVNGVSVVVDGVIKDGFYPGRAAPGADSWRSALTHMRLPLGGIRGEGRQKKAVPSMEIGAPETRMLILANRPDAPGLDLRTRYLDTRDTARPHIGDALVFRQERAVMPRSPVISESRFGLVVPLIWR